MSSGGSPMSLEDKEYFRAQREKEGQGYYIFFRDTGWYPLELKDDADAIRNAEINPGTLRVENIHGRAVWTPEMKGKNG